jgi:predicted transcriptional regulator
MLLFIAIFVFLGAQAEAQAVEMRAVFEGAAVRDAMTTRFRSLSPGDTLRQAVDELLAGHQQDFPVVEDGRVIGLLHRNKLIEAFSSGRQAEAVRDAMSADCPVVQDRDRLDQAVQLMQTRRCTTLPVLHDGRLVGLLTSENVGEWTMVQAALRDREETDAPAHG